MWCFTGIGKGFVRGYVLTDDVTHKEYLGNTTVKMYFGFLLLSIEKYSTR